VNEQELRRHLNEAHRQLLERDNAYRVHEEELEQLRVQLAKTQAWALQLETNAREMQSTRAWRFALWLRSLRVSGRRLARFGR
jgi:hypothetical protein